MAQALDKFAPVIKSIKQKILIGLAIMAVLILALLFGVFRLELDVAMALWALAGFIVAYTIYMTVAYLLTPRRTVTISTKVEFSAPPLLLKRVKNYKLKVSSEKHIEEKGKERNVKMDELVMSFNSADHPDAYGYSMQVIALHVESCMKSAQDAHPDAHVHGSRVLLPPELKQLEEDSEA